MAGELTRPRQDRLFGTSEVALIVNCPEWRVKNFMQPAYGLPPSQMLGAGGRGSRRLYNYQDVKRVQIAEALVRCGFAPEAVGAGVREVPESWLRQGLNSPMFIADEGDNAELPILVAQGGEWRTGKMSEVHKQLATVARRSRYDAFETLEDNLFVLNVLSLLHRMFWRQLKLEAEGKLSRWLLEDEEIRSIYEEESEG